MKKILCILMAFAILIIPMTAFASNKDIVLSDQSVSEEAETFVESFSDDLKQLLEIPGPGLGNIVASQRVYPIDTNKVISGSSCDPLSLLADNTEAYYFILSIDGGKYASLGVDNRTGTIGFGAAAKGITDTYFQAQRVLSGLLGLKDEDTQFKLYMLDFYYTSFLMSVTVDGTEYVIPFRSGMDIEKIFKGTSSYRELPTAETFIEKYRKECLDNSEKQEKSLRSGNGYLYGNDPFEAAVDKTISIINRNPAFLRIAIPPLAVIALFAIMIYLLRSRKIKFRSAKTK